MPNLGQLAAHRKVEGSQGWKRRSRKKHGSKILRDIVGEKQERGEFGVPYSHTEHEPAGRTALV